MRVLFCVIPEKGHINPYIGPAQALRDSGVEVIVHAAADISPQLRAAGLDNFVGPRDHPPSDAHRGAEFAAHVRDSAWLREWIKALLVDAASAAVEPTQALLRAVQPDVVVLDPMLYAVVIACCIEGVPWAAVSNSLNPVLTDDIDSELLRTVRWLAPQREALFAKYGLAPRFRGCDVLSPHLTIAFTTSALVGTVPGVALVGPSLPRTRRGDETAFPWERLDSNLPIVYMSLGSQIYHHPRLFRQAIDAVRGKPVQLVLSASDLANSPELGELPSNVMACGYVPQLQLLGRAAAFITHGGANSVMEAIACSVPLLVGPICNDQFHQAHFVLRAGIGRTFDPDATSADALWEAIEALVSDGPVRQRMAEVARSYQCDGAGETARQIIALGEGTLRAPE
jgi:zeaxanthin glucosyltransferase